MTAVLKAVAGWVGQRILDLAKLGAAYVMGRVHERRAQEEAARADEARARELRANAEDSSRDELIDSLARDDSVHGDEK